MNSTLIVMAAVGLTATAIAIARRKRQAQLQAQPVATIVQCDDQGMTLLSAKASPRLLKWRDLESVEIHTNDLGPFATDLFWVLRDGDGSVSVPQDAQGNEIFLEHLQKLPGFDNEAAIRAMGSTSVAVFPLWRRARSPS